MIGFIVARDERGVLKDATKKLDEFITYREYDQLVRDTARRMLFGVRFIGPKDIIEAEVVIDGLFKSYMDSKVIWKGTI